MNRSSLIILCSQGFDREEHFLMRVPQLLKTDRNARLGGNHYISIEERQYVFSQLA